MSEIHTLTLSHRSLATITKALRQMETSRHEQDRINARVARAVIESSIAPHNHEAERIEERAIRDNGHAHLFGGAS